MSYDSAITVTGYVGSDPRFFAGEGEAPDFVNFRLATTRSYFNRAKNTWIDGETIWFTVKAWRGLARNISDSLAKGDAVIVNGVLDTQKWSQQDGQIRESLVIEAQSVGPNLARGTARFRPQRTSASQQEKPSSPQGFEQAVPGATTDFDQAAAALTKVGEGEYAAAHDESLTNGCVDESKMALTA